MKVKDSTLTFIVEKTMTSQRIGYVRVSSLDQNPERQLDGIKLDKVFTDKASAKAMLSVFAQFERTLIKERQREGNLYQYIR
jgi:DNA invertase Pin-like site-specific DNA recombinase